MHSFVRGKVNQKMWGRNRLRQELKLRQINQKMIDIALKEEIDADKYWSNLLHLTRKKFNLLASERESFKKTNKVKAYLAYKGYEFDLMNDAIEIVKSED